MDVLLAENRCLECSRFGGGCKPELLIEPAPKGTVGGQRFVLTSEPVEPEHCDSMCALAEAVECSRFFCVSECAGVVELGQRRVRGVQVRAEHASVVRAPKILRPGRV